MAALLPPVSGGTKDDITILRRPTQWHLRDQDNAVLLSELTALRGSANYVWEAAAAASSAQDTASGTGGAT